MKTTKIKPHISKPLVREIYGGFTSMKLAFLPLKVLKLVNQHNIEGLDVYALREMLKCQEKEDITESILLLKDEGYIKVNSNKENKLDCEESRSLEINRLLRLFSKMEQLHDKEKRETADLPKNV